MPDPLATLQPAGAWYTTAWSGHDTVPLHIQLYTVILNLVTPSSIASSTQTYLNVGINTKSPRIYLIDESRSVTKSIECRFR